MSNTANRNYPLLGGTAGSNVGDDLTAIKDSMIAIDLDIKNIIDNANTQSSIQDTVISDINTLNTDIDTITDNISDINTVLATKQSATDVDARISQVIGTAAANVDTLGELADKLADDESAVAAIVTSIGNEVTRATGVEAGLRTDVDAASGAITAHAGAADPHSQYTTAQRVRDLVLTGLSTATNAVIEATDSVLSAFGKLQKQITDLATSVTNGDFTLRNYNEKFQALGNVSGAVSLALTNGCNISATITGNTTFTLPGIPSSGTAAGFSLRLINAGAYTVSFTPTPIKDGGTAVTFTASGRDELAFSAQAGDSVWEMLVCAKDVK